MSTLHLFTKRIYILLVSLTMIMNLLQAQKARTNWPIITRKGDELFEGSKPFRFMGLAAPNIQQNESQIRTDRTNRFPDEYEIRDILDGIKRIGGRATRTFSFPYLQQKTKACQCI